MNIHGMMADPDNWKKTFAKTHYVYIGMPRKSTVVRNVLDEKVYPCYKNNFIVSGPVGELSVMSVADICHNYVKQDGSRITMDYLNKKVENNAINWFKAKSASGRACRIAFHIPIKYTDVPIKTPSGEILIANRSGIKHGAGDFIVTWRGSNGRPDWSEIKIVNGILFSKTYDMRSFPELCVAGSTKATDIPKPKYDIDKY